MYIHMLIACVVSWTALASAGVAKGGSETTHCYTGIAKTLGRHPGSTSWTTSYTPCTSTSTKTVTSTITPTSTVTTTTTTTITVSTASTVPAPATFIPVQTSLPGSTYSGSGGTDPAGKRDLGKSLNPRSKQSPLQFHGKTYPQGVHCCAWKPQPTCHTTVTTITTTVAVTGSASLTTVTSTSTATTTSFTTTVYAACASNNLADTYVGGTHFIEGEGGFVTVGTTTTDSAYDCCVAALLDNGGDTNVWVFEPSTGECDIGETDGTCPDPGTNPSTIITSPDGTLVIGNAYCGEFAVAEPEFSGLP